MSCPMWRTWGLFWEVMAPVFFEMQRHSTNEGGFSGVPARWTSLVNGIFAVAGRPIYHQCSLPWRVLSPESFPNQKDLQPGSYEAGTPLMWRAVFYARAAISAARRAYIRLRLARFGPPSRCRISLRLLLMPMCSSVWARRGIRRTLLIAGQCCIFCRLPHRAITYSTSAAKGPTSW